MNKQNKLQKMLKTIMLIFAMSISSSSLTRAEVQQTSEVTCEEVIKAADKAIEEQENRAKAAEKVIDTAKKLHESCELKNVQAEKEIKAWYRDPFVMVPVGAVIPLGIIISPFIFIAAPVIVIVRVLISQ